MLDQSTLLIRADASPEIGTGHVMRCLALAQAWLEKEGKVHFAMAMSTPALELRLQEEGITIHHLSVVLGAEEDASLTADIAKQVGAEWTVVDGYHFDGDYQRVIKEAGLKLLFLDDYGHAVHYSADLILNQNVYAHEGFYEQREVHTQLLLGTKYVLLRKEFSPWFGRRCKFSNGASKILVTLGGSDPANMTLKIIKALQAIESEDIEVIVIVGGSNPRYKELQSATEDSKIDISLQYNVTNMPELMAWADIAITAGGSTCWELMFMGLPSLIVILAENQRQATERLDVLGSAINLGWHQNFDDKLLATRLAGLIDSLEQRTELARRACELVDGQGSSRIIMRLRGQELRLRTAVESDCKLLWNWSNDPEVRLHSFSSELIPWDEHVQWFNRKLRSPNSRVYIAVNAENTSIGLIRFDIYQDEATVSVCIDEQYRGQGYGKSLIALGTEAIFRTSDVTRARAYAKLGNSASINSFLKSGYQDMGVVDIEDQVGMQARLLTREKHHQP